MQNPEFGANVSIDPGHVDNEAVRLELAREIGDLTPEELERMAAHGPAKATADEKGRVHGRVLEIRGDDVFVDIGGKSEAFVSLAEFEEHHPPEAGKAYDFVMQGIDAESGLMRLSLREARLEADLATLSVGDVIEGRVTGVNLGGLELVSGPLRAFMPKSQVELERVEDFAAYIGRRLECQISEIDRKGKSLVVSRRRLLERERAAQREQLKVSLEAGQVRHGVVRRLTDFGAFVDLGGLEGLLHVSDIRHGHIKHPQDVLKPGQQIEVKILKIDLVKDRISLGMKQLEPDPWELAPSNYRAGDSVNGTVVRLADFGAFVELQPGIEGLIPVSEISWTQRVRHPRDVLKEGDSVRCAVLSVDGEKRKIGLSLKALAQDPWTGVQERYTPDSIVSGRVKQLTEFGAFIELEEGVEGLVHISEMSDRRIRTPGDVAKVGDVIQVRVKSVDTGQRRISLSMRIAAPAPADAAAPGAAHAMPHHRPAAAPPKKRKKPLKGGLD